MQWTKDELREIFNGSLPGITAHDLVMSYPRPTVQEILDGDRTPRMSAVIFLLYPKDQEWHFLLLKRHDYDGVHAGQVGLPGGSLEDGESKVEAALREFQEETGIHIDQESLVCSLSPLYIPPSNFIVDPFVAIIDSDPAWDFDSIEVKFGLEVPLSDLLLPTSLSERSVLISGGTQRLRVKAFTFEDEIVWGATAMILSECKQILLTLAP